MKNILHTKEQVEEIFSTALSVSDAPRKLGFSSNNYRKVHYLAKFYNLEKPVYNGSSSTKAATLKNTLK